MKEEKEEKRGSAGFTVLAVVALFVVGIMVLKGDVDSVYGGVFWLVVTMIFIAIMWAIGKK